MKSLSDYINILRDTATNLNLHGESVEMVVQMLANALYISEVEHVAYSQEASLERANLENSKIQHCVNQMYSVYRGANPRVIMNIKATKLFEFQTHQEIIKSNNYKVYYLGYFDEESRVIKYSDRVVYPDTTVTIVGLLASEVLTDSWTVNYRNTYYHNFKGAREGNLSGDLYLEISDERKDITRVFSDHISKDISFDLTLPGYGLRLYYPEFLQGDKGINTSYYLTVYRYLQLSDILDSEKKALKMVGSYVTSFQDSDRSWILDVLNAEETYPGLIFIPETPRDGIDTLHHKANRNRYTGTYLSTNSDLSWLLQEYYPNKIRRNGVTYRMQSPKSSSIVTITSEKNLKTDISEGGTFLSLAKQLKGLPEWIESELGYLPEGELTLRYRKDTKLTGSNTSYTIIPSQTVIPVQATEGYISPSINDIQIQIFKNFEGQTDTLFTYKNLKDEGLTLEYQFPESSHVITYTDSVSSNPIKIPVQVSGSTDKDLIVTLKKGSKVLDTEYIPFVYTPVTRNIKTLTSGEGVSQEISVIEASGAGDYYTLNLDDDQIYLQTDYQGIALSPGITKATLYYNGKEVQASYSLYPVSDVQMNINSETGDIEITGMSLGRSEATVAIQAKHENKSIVKLLTIRKSISNLSEDDRKSGFTITGDTLTSPILEVEGLGTEIKESVIKIPGGTFKSLKINSNDVFFETALFKYSYKTITNIIGQSQVAPPSLNLYYIPYSDANILDESEILEFKNKNKAYYITQDINIEQGKLIVARFNISLELYQNTSLDQTVLEILERYEYQFGQDFGGIVPTKTVTDSGKTVTVNAFKETDIFREIKSLLTKISAVKNVEGINITYLDTSRNEISYEDIKRLDEEETPVYFKVECNISSFIKS